MFAYPGQEEMLRDIEREVAYTRHEIGRDAFAPRVMAAMAAVPREEFVPESSRHYAFANGPLAIGHGQTISQPYIVALMTDLLAPRRQDSVLEIGTGSGYQAAVLAKLVKRVYTLEIVAALAREAGERLRRLGYDNVEVREGNGRLGWPEHAPYDAILVAAAATRIPPALIEQLKPGGILVIPVGEQHAAQDLMVIRKQANGRVEETRVLPVAFVPLTGAANG